MKSYFYLGDSKDFSSSEQDKNRQIVLASAFSLESFLEKNRLVSFDLLIICGQVDDYVLSSWLECLDKEAALPPIAVLSDKVGKHELIQKKYPILKAVIEKSDSIEKIWADLEKLCEKTEFRDRNNINSLPEESDNLGLVGVSPAISDVRRKIRKYAGHNMPVLILGESGTGKELVARALHKEGPGTGSPFEWIQASPKGEELFDSNMYGVRKGAYTGAEYRTGLMELANGGVLFIDEIALLSQGNQISLLRVLEEKIMRPLGSNKAISVDFRFISATNEIFPDVLESGMFRRDLYHRISTLIIRIPPLRKRKEDIIPLAEYFLSKERLNKKISSHARHRLEGYVWHGNIRELSNIIKRSVIESEGRDTIEARDLIFF